MALVIGLVGIVAADYWSAIPVDAASSFVGRSACIDCHQQQAAAFEGSHHDLAMDLATDATVLGDFDDATFEHDGLINRLFRDGDKFMVHTEGPNGEMEDFQVKYVFGVDPLQQYMVEFDRTDDMPDNEIGRLQVLRISWDTTNKRWFYLRPPDVPEKLEPDDPLHWTGTMQRWQTMCADCHSTDLKRNFDVATATYHTTFSEIDVSCEACHGPGSMHVELANKKSLFWDRNHGYGLARLKGEDPEPQLQACAPCHSRRGVLDSTFHAGEKFHDFFSLELLQPQTYHDDGQIKDEVYVYGSFIQSKMYHKGIRCTDCHDPHSLELKHPGNETCTSCHQHAAGKYDVPSHHHHAPGTAGAMCVNCHMPHTTYMEVDPRRDHSLRVPRPDLSVAIGTPNACSGCHVTDQLKSFSEETRSEFSDKDYAFWQLAAESGNTEIADAIRATDQWCEDACQKWYGENRKTPDHFATPLAKFRSGDRGAVEELLKTAIASTELVPDIAKATAINELAMAGIGEALPAAKQLVKNADEHPMVRAAAINAFLNTGPATAKKFLMPMLQDKSPLVRGAAARVLLSTAYPTMNASQRSQVDIALEGVRKSIMVASDRGGAHMNWGMVCEQQGRLNDAAEAYETAMRLEPSMTGPRTNLASVMERSIQQAPRELIPSLNERIKELRSEELVLLQRDARLAPSNPDIQYRYGLSLYLNGKNQEALEYLKKAVSLAPENQQFQMALRLLSEKLAE
ncbi:tetratricopeptide repeat protein [Planctomycetes bacterium K23_9]|uniref:Tetratricopeptide repeat protein n=1 Tax=Stieleria marina TaxID=1930275 RepID=A0A517NU35_9BACT|nr:Tetratricopeptide repeat protein [Planctomycetes bacterium K23_9]